MGWDFKWDGLKRLVMKVSTNKGLEALSESTCHEVSGKRAIQMAEQEPCHDTKLKDAECPRSTQEARRRKLAAVRS